MNEGRKAGKKGRGEGVNHDPGKKIAPQVQPREAIPTEALKFNSEIGVLVRIK